MLGLLHAAVFTLGRAHRGPDPTRQPAETYIHTVEEEELTSYGPFPPAGRMVQFLMAFSAEDYEQVGYLRLVRVTDDVPDVMHIEAAHGVAEPALAVAGEYFLSEFFVHGPPMIIVPTHISYSKYSGYRHLSEGGSYRVLRIGIDRTRDTVGRTRASYLSLLGPLPLYRDTTS